MDRTICTGEKIVFSKTVLGKPDTYMQKSESWPYLTSYTKIDSKCIKTLNIIPEVIKLLKESIGSKLLDINTSNFLLVISLQAMEMSKNKQLAVHLTKNLLFSKGIHQQNGKATYWMRENICKSYVSSEINIQNI